MPEVERKLTTILAADVVAFSEMMGRDEVGTVQILKTCRGIIEECIRKYRGRVFGGAGDSLIAEFASPLSAVLCANDFQESIAARNRDCPEPQRMWFRTGINLGDVMIDGDNLYGEGVNIAARLEQEGEPGGVCISQKVHEEVRRNLSLPFVDGGLRVLKNIDRPVGVFHLRPTAEEMDIRPASGAKDKHRPTLMSPKRTGSPEHSLIVRAFKVAGGGDFEFLAEGLREGLLNSLSKHSAINVVHEQSTSQEQADFTLEGSVRGRGGRVRLIFNLIDATNNSQVWSERYDRESGDFFDLEEEISRAVAAAIRVKLKVVEFEHLWDAKDEDLSVAELLNKAAGYFVSGTDKNDLAEASLRLALAREPDNSMSIAMLSFCLYRSFDFTPLALPARSEETIIGLAEQAISLNAESYFAHLVVAITVQDLRGDFERALRHAQAALESNPDLIGAHGMIGIATSHLGDPKAGIAIIRRILDTSREDPHRFRHLRELAIALFVAGDLGAANDMIGQLVESEPQMDRNKLVQAALLWLQGDHAAAIAVGRRLSDKHVGLSMPTRRPIWFGRADAAAHFDEALAAILV
jgi:class 3 adenylate cyclase/tetratricopeptide (TPR) repeat protein